MGDRSREALDEKTRMVTGSMADQPKLIAFTQVLFGNMHEPLPIWLLPPSPAKINKGTSS